MTEKNVVFSIIEAISIKQNQVKVLLDAEWNKLENCCFPRVIPTVLWSYYVSPPFTSKRFSSWTVIFIGMILAVSCTSHTLPEPKAPKLTDVPLIPTMPAKGAFDKSKADLTDVSELLKRARWTHEPTAIIEQAVRILDERLDQNQEDRQAWLQLGEALAIGFANSKHATSDTAAWQKAYELDPTDCHTGALAARSLARAEAERCIRELRLHHPKCPEALYLSSLVLPGSGDVQIQMLQDSIAVKKSAEALVALGQERIRAHDWKHAIEEFAAALDAPALFPEDWRPDGWATVHTRLGLAWCHYSRGALRSARREYEEFMGVFSAPGPWHDLSQEEEGWRNTLTAQWPNITGLQGNE